MFTANTVTLTEHAQNRCYQRGIPQQMVELIHVYGAEKKARGGVKKAALSRDSLSKIRKDFGRDGAKRADRYRRAYIVCSEDNRVITVAWSKKALFH